MSENPEDIYLVTGAAGHLGSTVIRKLQEKGCRVRGLILPHETAVVEGAGIFYVHGDVRDRDSMRKLFEGTGKKGTVVIHTAALISIAEKMPPDLYDVNVRGTKNVISLCREYHIKRLVHVSSVHAIPELPNGRRIQEIKEFSTRSVRGGYAKTKAAAAQAVLDAAARGLDACIVFPSGIIGPFDSGRNHLVQMVSEYMKGKLPACVKGGYDFVDVRDAAEGCLRAAEYGKRGEGYILSGHYCSIRRLLSMVSKELRRKKIPVIPMPLARAAVPFIALYGKMTHQRPLYTSYSLHTLCSNGRFSNQKAKKELGYQTRSLEETVSDMVSWLQSE